MSVKPTLFALSLVLAATAQATLDEARLRLRERDHEGARAILEALVQAEPRNAAGWHQLGLAWREKRDHSAYERAIACLEKAVELEPRNAKYLADFGGTSMEFANRSRSITAATRGRDAMEKSVLLDPNDVEAREGLFHFYTRAPFIVGGSSRKAAAQLEHIRRIDPDRATTLEVVSRAAAKDYTQAFALCDAVLARQPENYVALYQYGRTASLSGQNLERGLSCLQKVLTLQPPGPNAPRPDHAWFRIGDVQEKLGRTQEARAAYRHALELEPTNQPAAAALARLGNG